MRDRLIKSTSATSNAQGVITFQLEPAEMGSVREGTLQVSNAPSGAQFTAKILGTLWGQWAGPTNFGPVQPWGGESIVVTGTGLAPNTQYVISFVGVSMSQNEAEPKPPVAPLSVVAVETSTPLISNAVVPAGSFLTVTVPVLTRRLSVIVERPVDGDVDRITVVGTTSSCVYGVVPLASGLDEPVFFPVEPTVDQSYLVQYSSDNPSATSNLWVVASTDNPLARVEPAANVSFPVVNTGRTPLRTTGPAGPYNERFRVGLAANTNNQQLVAAPGAGLAIVVQSLQWEGSTGATGATFHWTGGGAFAVLGTPLAAGSGTTSIVFPNGFQLATNTALQADCGTIAVNVVGTYAVINAAQS